MEGDAVEELSPELNGIGTNRQRLVIRSRRPESEMPVDDQGGTGVTPSLEMLLFSPFFDCA